MRLPAILFTVSALLLAYGCGDSGSTAEALTSQATATPSNAESSSSPPPRFDQADTRRTKRIVRADPKLSSVTEEAGGFSIKTVGSFSDEGNRLIGGAALLALRKPLNLTTTIPVLCFPKHGYIAVPVKWKFDGARTLNVLVDFSKNRVVGYLLESGSPVGDPPREPRACAANAEPPGY